VPACPDNIPPIISSIEILPNHPHTTNEIPESWFGNRGEPEPYETNAPPCQLDLETTFPLPTLLTLRANATDPDGTIGGYAWDLGDGTTALSAGDTVVHSYRDFGTYTVVATATDDRGARSSSATFVDLNPAACPPPAGEPPIIGYGSLSGLLDVSAAVAADTPLVLICRSGILDKYFIPNIETDVRGMASVLVSPAVGASISSVRMDMIDPAGRVVMSRSATIRESGRPNFGLWGAIFNMSDLPKVDHVQLRVTATDNESPPRHGIRFYTIPLCAEPLFFGLPGVDELIRYDPSRHIYTLEGGFPSRGHLWQTKGVYPLIGHAESHVDARLTHQMWLDGLTGTWRADPLRGFVGIKLFDVDVLSEELLRVASGSALEPCSYSFRYAFNRVDLIRERRSFEKALFSISLGPVVVGINLGGDVGLVADGELTVRSAGTPVTLDFRLTPEVNVRPSGRVGVGFPPFSLELVLRATITVALPVLIRLTPVPPSVSFSVDACIRIVLDLVLRACLKLWFLIFDVELFCFDLFDVTVLGPLEIGGGCRLGSSAGVDPQVDAPLPQPSPSIASSPDQTRTMTVFVKEIVPDARQNPTELYYSIDTGSGFSAPAPLFVSPDAYIQQDPDVAFLPKTGAIAVWMEITLPNSELTALLKQPNGNNVIRDHQDIRFSIWSEDDGWSSPQRLTDDGEQAISDATPKVAAIPGREGALVAFVRADEGGILDDSGFPRLALTSIYVREIADGVPAGDMVKISGDDSHGQFADIQPAIAVSPANNEVFVAWVRDLDGVLGTAEDRMIMYSKRTAGTWSTPHPITDPADLPGVMTPGIAFSSDGDGMVAFTVRSRNEEGVIAGEGNLDLIYTAVLREGVFEPAQEIRGPRCVRGGKVYGKDPRVCILDEANAAVVFRRMGAIGTAEGLGELAVAAVDLADPYPVWSLARTITDDEVTDWQIDAAPGPQMVRTVRVSDGSVSPFDHLNFEDITWVPDLSVDSLRLSDPHALPGTLITLTAVLRNAGLRSPHENGQSTNARVFIVQKHGAVEVAAIPLAFDAAPDEVVEVSHVIRIAPEVSRIRVVVHPIADEVNTENNASETALGVQPPNDVVCTNASTAGSVRVQLGWINADTYESILIYRDGRLIEVLPGSAASHAEFDASLGRHSWSVRGQIGQSLSYPEAASCHAVVSLADCDGDGDVDLADFAPVPSCLTGPDGSLPQGCPCADRDGDGDADLDDVARIQNAFTGAYSKRSARANGVSE
jgi:hypothetical protein